LKVLVNASTLAQGGALQVASSLFMEIERDGAGIEWHWLVSPTLREELEKMGARNLPRDVTVISRSPARNRDARQEAGAAERSWRPDVVFTIFGPAYVRFHAPHLCGVADGWVTHAGLFAYRKLGRPGSIAKMLLTVAYKTYWFRQADAWVVEARVAKEGLVRRHLLPASSIRVVPNSCGAHFQRSGGTRPFPPGGHVRILSMSAYHRHKDLESIPAVARQLLRLEPRFSFEFVMTLAKDGPGARKIEQLALQCGVGALVRNIGSVSVSRAVAIYEECDIVFLPSVLETFSANFPEAMAMGLPIVTTDFQFNRDVCGDAALYYRGGDSQAAAAALSSLLSNPDLWDAKVAAGKAVLAKLPDPRAKLEAYAGCLRELHGRKSEIGKKP
jgi:glycosyltransferase involved in cell wall biosynthesis